MRIIYAPKGGEPQRFNVTVDDLLGAEAELIEDVGGTQWDTYGEWLDRLTRGGWRPMKAFVWVLLRRANPTLLFEDLADLSTAEVLFAEDEDDEEGKDESGEVESEMPADPTNAESLTQDSEP